MNYYIPTSSLNLDNILQAESISPFSFYAERISGYRHFEIIQELKGIDRIVLFQFPVSFSINDPNRYNYPLLIEVNDDNQLAGDGFRCESTGIYTYSKTLYLTPTNCRFYFFSESAYKLTTINTRSNKAIKYYEKYLIFPTTNSLLLQEMPIVGIDRRKNIANNLEPHTDKIKGLLYALLLGQTLSVSPGLAHQIKLTQEIYDTILGIMANPSMVEKLNPKLNKLLDEYKSTDAIEKENEQRFNSCLDTELKQYGLSTSGVIDLLKSWGEWDSIYSKLSNKWCCNFLPQISKLISRDDYKRLIDDVKQRTEQSIANYRKTKPRPSLSAIHDNNNKIIILDNLPIITIAVNYIINNNLTPNQLSAHRTEHCVGIINKIKEYYICEHGEYSWNKNVRNYVNNLYSHIQNLGIPFNIQSIENPELIAISAFLLKGHNIDKFLTFLKMNEISDYQYPLMLWGTMCGYMEMNKDALSLVLNMEYYEDVYRCLFKKDMFKAEWNEIQKISKNNNNSADSNEFDSFMESIKKECSGAGKDKPIYQDLYSQYGLSPELLDKIKADSRLNNGKSVQKGVVRKIEKMLKKNKVKKSTKKNNTNTLLFKIDCVSTPFYKDDTAWDGIQSMVPFQVRKDVQETLSWFQTEYQKGNGSDYYARASRENSAVIEAFGRALLKKDYIKGKYEKEIERIISYLHTQYDKQ